MILIGVVFTGDPRMQQVFRGNYGKAVRRGGGVPVFLPWKPKHAAFWAKHLDGFLFTGGGDPDPRYYGQSMRPECGTPTPARDEFELALLKAVMDTGKPVLGICRGEQILNVALGGTLIQDIPSQRPEAAGENHRDNEHRYAPRHASAQSHGLRRAADQQRPPSGGGHPRAGDAGLRPQSCGNRGGH